LNDAKEYNMTNSEILLPQELVTLIEEHAQVDAEWRHDNQLVVRLKRLPYQEMLRGVQASSVVEQLADGTPQKELTEALETLEELANQIDTLRKEFAAPHAPETAFLPGQAASVKSQQPMIILLSTGISLAILCVLLLPNLFLKLVFLIAGIGLCILLLRGLRK
jgi:Flp pilus assembly protein TadB